MFEGWSPELVWLVLGILLLLCEIFIPGLIVAFFGVGALITALTTWLGLTSSLMSQVVVFSVCSIVLVLVVHHVMRRVKAQRADREETTNFNIQIGKIVNVIEYIDPLEASGKVRYQGADWRARCSEKVAPGESVRVTGCDNLTLIVEPLQAVTVSNEGVPTKRTA